ncbi:RsiV family protein [Oceanobacillus manasiensis]|uniref:RsiV family protein n=1 Tax=Oceanobacillus manasiensis TaxID=586413 RepID=UPI0005A8C91C|nr:RsiV family protein [Oceanobacillus manasiensis]
MKNVILPFTILFLIVSGCSNKETGASNTEVAEEKAESEEVEHSKRKSEETTKNEHEEDIEEDLVNNLENYETVVLEEVEELKELTIEYPKFSYDPLDEIISGEMEKEVEHWKSVDATVESYENPSVDLRYFITKTFEKPIITKEFVSIYFEDRIAMGGTGHSVSHTMTFNLMDEQLITLNDVLKEHETSLEEIAELVAQELISGEKFAEYRGDSASENYKERVYEETEPVESNYESFTLTEKSITFYKQYFSIFPNAAGIVGVEVTWDELKEYQESNMGKFSATELKQDNKTYEFGSSVGPTTTLTYIDNDYGFSMKFPKSWKNKYKVRISEDYYEHLIKDPSKSIVFSMVEDGAFIGDLFSIEVLEDIDEGGVEKYYENWPGFEGYIGAGNGIVLVYTRPGMMPEQLYDEPYINTGNQFSRMVEEDMPDILETLKFK